MDLLSITVQNFKIAIDKKAIIIGGNRCDVFNYMDKRRKETEKYLKEKWTNKNLLVY